jgi:hypothetical protein
MKWLGLSRLAPSHHQAEPRANNWGNNKQRKVEKMAMEEWTPIRLITLKCSDQPTIDGEKFPLAEAFGELRRGAEIEIRLRPGVAPYRVIVTGVETAQPRMPGAIEVVPGIRAEKIP